MFYIGLSVRPLCMSTAPDYTREFVETFAVYSFATLKLSRVFLTRNEAEGLLVTEGMTKCILVRYSYFNNDCSYGSKRLGYTPEKLPKRLRFTDCRKEVFWNPVDGVIASDVP